MNNGKTLNKISEDRNNKTVINPKNIIISEMKFNKDTKKDLI